jgi:hypothetical protein
LKSPRGVDDTAENAMPVFLYITKKLGCIKPPNGQKRGKIFKVFNGLDMIHSRTFFSVDARVYGG